MKRVIISVIGLAAAWALAGCAAAPEAPAGLDVWKAPPAEGFDTWTVHSSDGKLQLTVVKPRNERAGQFASASQIRLRHADPKIPDRVWSWGPDGPHAAGYPILTECIPLKDNLYVLLGWMGHSVTDVDHYAWLVRADKNRLSVGWIVFEGGQRLVLDRAAGRLGLFWTGEGAPDGLHAWVVGRQFSREQLLADSQPASGRFGMWYTRGARAGSDPGEGRVCWVETEYVAKRLAAADREAWPAPEAPTREGLLAFINGAIAKANVEAAKLDGKTFVEYCDFNQSVSFLPLRDPAAEGKGVHARRAADELRSKHWTDHYVQAQNFRYRYSLIGVEPIASRTRVTARKTYRVSLRLTAWPRTAMAADEQPIPEPPAGMGALSHFGGGGESVLMMCRHLFRDLDGIAMPEVMSEHVEGQLAKEAVKKLSDSPEDVIEVGLKLYAEYTGEKLWRLTEHSMPRRPAPKLLRETGVSRGPTVESQLAETQPGNEEK